MNDELVSEEGSRKAVKRLEVYIAHLDLLLDLGETMRQEFLDRAEDAEDQLGKIKDWCEAYPVEIFTPVSRKQMKRAHALLEAEGISLSAIHGEWARHLLSGIAKLASATAEQHS